MYNNIVTGFPFYRNEMLKNLPQYNQSRNDNQLVQTELDGIFIHILKKTNVFNNNFFLFFSHFLIF